MTRDRDNTSTNEVPGYSQADRRYLDNRIAEAGARLREAKELIERQRKEGVSTAEAEVLRDDIALFIADLRAYRRRLLGA